MKKNDDNKTYIIHIHQIDNELLKPTTVTLNNVIKCLCIEDIKILT